MMAAYKLLYQMDAVSDEQILEAKEFLGYGAYQKRRGVKKAARTLLLAAVIASLLTVSAFAVGYTLHQRRQASLRDALKIEENAVSGYVEVEEESAETAVPAAPEEPRVQVISTMDRGESQVVYFSISPVSREEAERLDCCIHDGVFWMLGCHVDNDPDAGAEAKESWHEATPYFELGDDREEHLVDVYDPDTGVTFQQLDREYLDKLRMEQAYDEESRSLMLECSFLKQQLDWSRPVYLTVELSEVSAEPDDKGRYKAEIIRDFGTAPVSTEAADCVTFDFTQEPVTLTNPANGATLKVLGLKVMPSSAEWRITHDELERVLGMAGGEEWSAWAAFYDEVFNDSYLLFDDGSEQRLGAANAFPHSDGVATPYSHWGSTIDIRKVSGVRIMGQEYELN